MKKLLSLLVVFVFLNVQSQAFAPDYGGLGLNPVGTYGGTLTPGTGAAAGAAALNGVPSADSLGLFSIGIPQVGLATGSFAVFIQGAAYVGDIIGYVDPNTQTFSAILSGDSTFKVPQVQFGGNNTFAVVYIPISVDGNMIATFTQGTLTTGAGTSTLITGTATLVSFLFVDANTGAPIPTATQTFVVNGVNQSGQVNPTTITLVNTSSQGG